MRQDRAPFKATEASSNFACLPTSIPSRAREQADFATWPGEIRGEEIANGLFTMNDHAPMRLIAGGSDGPAEIQKPANPFHSLTILPTRINLFLSFLDPIIFQFVRPTKSLVYKNQRIILSTLPTRESMLFSFSHRSICSNEISHNSMISSRISINVRKKLFSWRATSPFSGWSLRCILRNVRVTHDEY